MFQPSAPVLAPLNTEEQQVGGHLAVRNPARCTSSFTAQVGWGRFGLLRL